MMRSLFSGVSGLKVHQTKMDVIGNNIANVNTVGFKASSVTFTDIFYQTTQSASGPNAETGAGGQNAKQIGLGATLGVISQNITGRGGAQRTDNAFDMMINGGGFFVVNKGGQNYFTKAGNFTTDESGTLVNGSGYAVMGWQANQDGTIKKERVSALKIMSQENLTTDPAATTKQTVSGNINKEDEAFASTEPINQYTTYAMKFYDNLGYEYEATYHIKQVDASQGIYSLNLYSLTYDGKPVDNLQAEKIDATATDPTHYEYLQGFLKADGTNIGADGTTLYLKFNTTGATVNQTEDGSEAAGTDAVAASVKPGGLLGIYSEAACTNYLGKSIDLSMKAIKGTDATGAAITTSSFPAAAETMEVNFSKLTCYGSKTTAGCKSGIDGVGKGKAVGKMSTIGVQTDGKIVANYSNGDTRILGQIVVANFSNPAGLEKAGENLFTTTLNSGEFDGIGDDVTENGDSFSTGVLEMSNVDLSTEFTEMITTQRGFQANSRIITTSDTMLEELINLKR